jgi:hypothetical protein
MRGLEADCNDKRAKKEPRSFADPGLNPSFQRMEETTYWSLVRLLPSRYGFTMAPV